MISPAVLHASTHLAWGGLAVLIALVLPGLHRLYDKDDLLRWARVRGVLAPSADRAPM